MDENEFESRGVIYVASKAINGCEGCAFDAAGDCYKMQRPFCYGPFREDCETIIFVERQQ